MAWRPAAGAAAARMLAVDCFMVRAIVAGLGVRRLGRCLAEAKVALERSARPIECLGMQQRARAYQSPKPLHARPQRPHACHKRSVES
jgi:hypothetical protein